MGDKLNEAWLWYLLLALMQKETNQKQLLQENGLLQLQKAKIVKQTILLSDERKTSWNQVFYRCTVPDDQSLFNVKDDPIYKCHT